MLIFIDGELVPLGELPSPKSEDKPTAEIIQFRPRSIPKMTEQRRQMFNHLADRIFSEAFPDTGPCETIPYGGSGIDGMPFDGKEPA